LLFPDCRLMTPQIRGVRRGTQLDDLLDFVASDCRGRARAIACRVPLRVAVIWGLTLGPRCLSIHCTDAIIRI
jgi:hypothetical protein